MAERQAADLGYPLILLEEATAHCGARAGNLEEHTFDALALRAKLTCASSLLARGRRFAVARQAGELIRLAILLIGHGRRGEARRKVTEGHGLLASYLGGN